MKNVDTPLTVSCRWTLAAAITVVVLAGPGAGRAGAQEVNGIYTDNTTKDLGEITNVALLKNIKVRGWVEASYNWNFNRVERDTANRNQALSALKDRDLTIEGQAFHAHHNSFTWDLAEVEIEKVPQRGEIGFKLDLAGGDIQDVIVDTIQAVSPTGVSSFDKVFQHASVSYVAPVGTGLRLDFGKFVTHIGGETIESIKNRNFSHSFFYSYAIPFQDSGLRMNYAFNPKVYGELYLLNGWNVTSDNNGGKTVGASVGITPNPKLTVYANYLGGPERNDNDQDWRHLGDFQVMFSPASTLQLMVNVDVGSDQNAVAPGTSAKWWGLTGYARGTVNGRFFPTVRAEYYNDADGFSTGVAQKLWGLTFTGDCRLGAEKAFTKMLVRPEVRYDKSDAPFFSRRDEFRSRDHQLTLGLGVVAYF